MVSFINSNISIGELMTDISTLIGKTLTACDTSDYMAVLTFSDGSVLRCHISEALTKAEYSAQVEAAKVAAKAVYDALVVKAEAVKTVVPKVL